MTNSYEIISPDSQLGISLSAGMQANLQTLQNTHPSVAALLNQDLLQKGLLARDEQSLLGILAQSAQGQFFEFLTEYENIEAIQGGIKQVFAQFHTVVFLGTGVGEFFGSTLDFITQTTDTSSRRYIFIEPRSELFQAALYLCNFSPLWLSRSVSLCVGKTWKEQLDRELEYGFEAQTLFAIHPSAVDRQVQLEISDLLTRLSEKPVPIWQKKDPNVKIAGPEGAVGFRETFNKNYEALKESNHCHITDEAIGLLASIQIVFEKTPAGAMYVRDENQKKLALTFRDEDRNSLIKRLVENYNVVNTYFVMGSGDAAFLKDIFNITTYRGPWNGYEQVVYVVEPSLQLFVLLLHLLDISDYLKRDRLRLFVGSTAIEKFSTYLRSEKHARIPNQYFACRYIQEGVLDTINAFCKMLEKELVAEGNKIALRLEEYYDSLPHSYWEDRFNGRKKLTIVGITSRMTSFLQYCTRDLLNGFEQHGHQAFILIEQDGTSSFSPTEILRQLDILKPDLIINIDHLRDESPWLPKKVPFFCWIQDMLPNLINFKGYTLQNFDFTYILVRSWEDVLKKNSTFKGFKQHELPIACNEQVYYRIEGVQKKYDVIYISHLLDPNGTLLPFADVSGLRYLTSKDRQLMSDLTISEQELQKIYEIILKSTDKMTLSELTVFATNQINANVTKRRKFLANRLKENLRKRHSAVVDYMTTGATRFLSHVLFLIKSKPICLLSEHGFQVAVWGNNWNLVSCLAHNVSRGVAQNGAMINEIQNASKICLNNSGILSFHMRALEIMASGSFMLSRRIENDGQPITDYLIEGEEIILFDNERDLLNKVEYYLGNEAERETLALNAMKKTAAQYTYFSTAGRLIRDINERMKNF